MLRRKPIHQRKMEKPSVGFIIWIPAGTEGFDHALTTTTIKRDAFFLVTENCSNHILCMRLTDDGRFNPRGMSFYLPTTTLVEPVESTLKLRNGLRVTIPCRCRTQIVLKDRGQRWTGCPACHVVVEIPVK